MCMYMSVVNVCALWNPGISHPIELEFILPVFLEDGIEIPIKHVEMPCPVTPC